MTAVAPSFPALGFEDFLARYLEDGQYELIDGELINLEPTGLHEQVAGFLNRQLNGAIDRHGSISVLSVALFALIPQPLLPEREKGSQSPSPSLGEGFRVRVKV